MMMKNYITEDYCSYEVAKLLKKKGFNEPCYRWYDGNGDICAKFITPDVPLDYFSRERYLCPTHQMTMKWLREVHNIFIVIEPHMYDYINEKNSSYVTSLWQGDNYYENVTSKDYPTYEEAVEATLKFSLENLI